MKQKLNVYYANVPNMGDLLNVRIIHDLFGYEVQRRTFLTGELSAIGSGLGQFTLWDNPIVALIQKVTGALFPDVTVWGTGFISYKDEDTPFYRKGIHFAAVRGQLSKARVEKLLGRKLDIPTGDAGILSSYLLAEKVEKKYDVGIIAHFKEQDESVFKTIVKHYYGSKFIDVRQEPYKVIRQIAECRCIMSSSLHGLIIADSLNIPNLHIVASEKPLGDGFKFDDYYSAYGIKHSMLDIRNSALPDLEWVKNSYRITPQMVERKQREMVESFPFKSHFIEQ